MSAWQSRIRSNKICNPGSKKKLSLLRKAYKCLLLLYYFFVVSVEAGVVAAGLVLFKPPPSGDGEGVLSKRS